MCSALLQMHHYSWNDQSVFKKLKKLKKLKKSRFNLIAFNSYLEQKCSFYLYTGGVLAADEPLFGADEAVIKPGAGDVNEERRLFGFWALLLSLCYAFEW